MAPINDPDYNALKQRRYRERARLKQDREVAVASLVRAAIATGMGKLDRNVRAADYARSQWSDHRVELVLRAAASPTALTNTPALAQIAVAFLNALTPMSAGADLLTRGIGLNFAGAAQITVPNIAIPTADFVGEAQPIPAVTAPTSVGPTLTPHKIAAITALTGEIMRSSNAETMVRQVLMESTGPAIDKVLFSTNAAGTDRPPGLLNGIAALTPAAAGEKAQTIVDDLQALATAVAAVAGNGEIAIVAAPAQAVALQLRMPAELTWPVLTSASLAVGTVVAVATNAVVSAVEGSPQIDASRDASVHWDTGPDEIVDIGGVYARPVASSFQTEAVALRLRWPISWALRASNGLAWMQGVNW